MIVTKIELRKLEAEKGMVLTNGTVFKDDFIYLGKNDSSKNWHEITQAEYNVILKEQEEKANESLDI